MKFDLDPKGWQWDSWQLELIEHRGHVSARCGRQTGKSRAVSRRMANQMLEYPGTTRLVIAPAQRQSSGLFEKCLMYLERLNRKFLTDKGGYQPDHSVSHHTNIQRRRQWEFEHGIFNELPTKTSIVLKLDFDRPPGLDNKGSVMYCYPAGKTGTYLRFLTLDFLDIDEAAFVPDVVYNTLVPMLAISQKEKGLGWETLLSTPFGKGGFFYHSQFSPKYRQFHVSAEKCGRYDKQFLADERKRLNKQQYAQEYLAEFSDEWNQLFPSDVLARQQTFISWSPEQRIPGSSFYLGVDIARYGGDENAFVVAELAPNKKMKIVKCAVTDRVSVVDTIQRIKLLDEQFNFKRIFVDDAGVGGGVTDMLQERLGRKVQGLNNSSRRVQIPGKELQKGILKEDLYSNMLMLLETNMLELVSDMRLIKSLKSITYEYGEIKSGERRVKIYGEYAHLAEAAVRATWCIKEKGLDLYIY